MEAMTIMGMAASQARFLGLTARKSNVEYQGQQINQQRTSLANESANLYNQMMELTVPTPPSTNDFNKTVYVLDDSKDEYNTSNYKITNAVKTYDAQNQYRVTLTQDVEQREGKTASYKVQKRTEIKKDQEYQLSFADHGYVYSVTYKPEELVPYKTTTTQSESEDEATEKYSLKVADNQIYQLTKENIESENYPKPTGFDEWLACYEDKGAAIKENGCYFYKNAKGEFLFITNSDFEKLNSDTVDEQDNYVHIGSSYAYYKPYSTEVIAIMETSENGRYSSIQISNDDSYPAILQNRTFSISATTEFDEQGYKDAFNEYEYQKALYEKSISDINAETEAIQNEDQQLELRLQQLDTEQNAISTEMDSVSKVIEDNVEKTFKVFA